MILQMTVRVLWKIIFYYNFMGPIVHIHVIMNYFEYITINTASIFNYTIFNKYYIIQYK